MSVYQALRGRIELLLRNRSYRELVRAKLRLRGVPRRTAQRLRILDYDLEIVDGASFLASFEEIFVRDSFRFESHVEHPRILDCGANIGLSVLYFKRLCGTARITAFEPDPDVFETLSRNVRVNAVTGVDLVPKAVWTASGELPFYSEGADAGRLEHAVDAGRAIRVPTVRLKDYLSEPVEFLKLDIEGAEAEVLDDISEELSQVRHLFVEYHSFVDTPQVLSGVLRVMENAGFRVQVRPVLVANRPFVERCDYLGMDLQLNLFGSRARVDGPAKVAAR